MEEAKSPSSFQTKDELNASGASPDKYQEMRHSLSKFALRLADHEEILEEVGDMVDQSMEGRSARLQRNID
jgi:hypothetical protein